MTSRTQQIEQLLESFQTIRRKLCVTGAPASKALRRVTPSQWGILRIIAKKNTVSIKDIATEFAISSSAATQLVDGLVNNGHVQRSTNPDDRRSQHISLSPTAKKQMQILRSSRLAELTEIFSALSDDELEDYLRLSAKVARHVTTRSS